MMVLKWLGVITMAVVLYVRQVYSRFSQHGVKHFKVCNLMNELMRKKHNAESLNDVYQSFPEERFVGRCEFMKSIVMIRDLELVKNITVKDFEHFLDHRVLVNDFVDPLFGRNLISLRGSRFALCEIKVMIYQLFQQIEVSPCEKTQILAVLARDFFNLKIKGGEYVRFKVRQ